MSTISKQGMREVMNITLYDLITKEPVIYFDTLKISNVDNTSDSVSATGGWGNAELVTWDHSKAVELAVQDALVSMKSLSILSGTSVEEGKTVLPRRVEIDDEGATATIPGTPGVDGEIKLTGAPSVSGDLTITLDGTDYTIPVVKDELLSSITDKIENKINGTADFTASSSTAGTLAISTTKKDGQTYAITYTTLGGMTITTKAVKAGTEGSGKTKVIQLDEKPILGTIFFRSNEGLVNKVIDADVDVDNMEVTVKGITPLSELFYKTEVDNTESVNFKTCAFPGYYGVHGETLMRDEATGKDTFAHFIIDKAKINGNFNFNLTADGEPTVLDFTFRCQRQGRNKSLYRIVKENEYVNPCA